MFIAFSFRFICIYPVPLLFLVELNVCIYHVSQLFWTIPVYDAVHFIPTELQCLVTPKNTIRVFTIVPNQLYEGHSEPCDTHRVTMVM